MNKTINILLVDDHQMVLDGLKLIMDSQEDFQVLGTCNNGKEAVNFVTSESVDIILMDLNMPVMNGIESSKKIKQIKPNVKILVLSMLSDVKLIKNLVKEGVNGYLLKNSGQDEIVSAIRQIHAGNNHFDQRIMEIMLGQSEKKQVKSEGMMPSLSRREKEILQLVIEEHTTAEIAKKLFISAGTVESHRRNMISKLGVRNTAGLVSAAYKYELLK